MAKLHGHVCGCYYTTLSTHSWGTRYPKRNYLPQVEVKAHTTILSTVSRTRLSQKFVVPSKTHGIRDLRYTFPLFDGVSVVDFKFIIGERVIVGEVEEKEQAKKTYDDAVQRGETAGLLEQLPQASDVFVTTIGNIPPGSTILVDIVYLGELKHDAEVDGVRFTIPTIIAPRYGDMPGLRNTANGQLAAIDGTFEVTVDITLEDESAIKELRSPSHPISVSLGTISSASNTKPSTNRASATLAVKTAQLSKDFVLQITSKDFGRPTAVLEQHSKIQGSRALMATLVPKFQLAQQRPEIVFVCDRSGSMSGNNITALRNALQLFLKSLPVGVVFNICSFGSSYSFLWEKSKAYNKESMEEAVQHVKTFSADYGGTEMLAPVKATLDRRFSDRTLEVFLVTDGEIWDQQTLFRILNERIHVNKEPVRLFTLGIGDSVSHALIEGVARAGDGFSQTVGENEKLDAKVVRMIKAALMPHVKDYRLELKYEQGEDDDFEIVEKVMCTYNIKPTMDELSTSSDAKKTISLFDETADADAPIENSTSEVPEVPKVIAPKTIQAPQRVPQIYPFNRTSVYVLISPDCPQRPLKSVVLRGTTQQGELELEIPVTTLSEPGQTIHQLAAKKAVLELEEGRGWLQEASTEDGKLVKDVHPSHFDELVRLETVRLGTTFQVGGKNCSFVAVEESQTDKDPDDAAYDFLDDLNDESSNEPSHNQTFAHAEMAPRQLNAPFGGAVASPFAPSAGSFGQSFGAMPPAPAPTGFKPLPPSGALQSTGSSIMANVALVQTAPSASTDRYRVRVEDPVAAPTTAPAYGGGVHGRDRAGQGMGGPWRHRRILAESSSPSPSPSPSPPRPKQKKAAHTASSDAASDVIMADEDMDFDLADDQADDLAVDGVASRSAPLADEDSPAQSMILPDDSLQALIELQTFEGNWEWTPTTLRTLKVDEAKAEQTGAAAAVDKTVLATVLAVCFLETKLVDEKDSWELIVDKARAWLESQVGVEKMVELFKVAQSLIVKGK